MNFYVDSQPVKLYESFLTYARNGICPSNIYIIYY